MISQYLPYRELQSILPEELIRNLAGLLLGLDETLQYNPLDDKGFLSKLYEAYYGIDLLSSKQGRKKLIDYLPDIVIRELCSCLELPSDESFDKLVDSIIALPWGPNDYTRRFLNFFGYPDDYLPNESAQISAQIELIPHSPPLKTLQDYQAEVFYRCIEILRIPCAKALVQMPTGSGKTRTAMEIISVFLNTHPNGSVLWLAHTEELCEQASDAFSEVWRHIGKYPIKLYRCWSNYSPDFPLERPSFTIAGFAKLNSIRKYKTISPKIDLVVVDEAHMVLAPTYNATVEWVKSINARVIGLSATPGRTTEITIENETLANYFNGQIIGITAKEGRGIIEYLQSRGILSYIKREALQTNITFHLTQDEWKSLEEELDYSKAFLERVAKDFERNKIIAKRLWQLAEQNHQVLIFAANLEQSRMLCALMLYKGIPAAHIDGDTSSITRRAIINKFKKGEIKFLFNYQVLSTGFDAPGINVVVIARPTKSIVLYSQMIGRGIRGPAVGGTDSVLIIDVIDNIIDYSSELDDVYEHFSEYWSR